MNLHTPERGENETQAEYRDRRKRSNQAAKDLRWMNGTNEKRGPGTGDPRDVMGRMRRKASMGER